jgi:membrane-associated phospholipid phosphatase
MDGTLIAGQVPRVREDGKVAHERCAAAATDVDNLSLAWLVLLALFAALLGEGGVVLSALGVAGGIVLSIRAAGRGRGLAIVHDFLPVLTVAAGYLMMGPLVEALSARRWDAFLAGVDATLFGALGARWRGLLGRPAWLSDVASVSYFAFYPMPIAMLVALRAGRRRAAFDDLALRLVATFLFSYCLYLAFPAVGPRPGASVARTVVGGGVISEGLRLFLSAVERMPWDAFPSGHTAIAAVCAACAPRLFPRAWPAVLVTSVAIVFSTVYLHLHYVVDVVGGIALMLLVTALIPALKRGCRALPSLQLPARGAGVVPLFARSDGELVRGEAPARRILPYLMRGRNESMVVHEATYDVSRAQAWLKAFNASGDRHATMFDLLLWAIARALHARPGLNRFVSGGRVYQRRGVFLSFAAKPLLQDDAPFVVVKLEVPAADAFATSIGRVHAALGKARAGSTGLVDRELALGLALPGPLLRAVMACLRGLDRFNLLPATMIASDPMFTSIFAANLGSIGLSRTTHHLYEYGTASVFAAMGRIGPMAFVGPGGQPELRDGLEVRFSLDERIQDGFYCAMSLALVKEVMEDPQAVLGPPSAVQAA